MDRVFIRFNAACRIVGCGNSLPPVKQPSQALIPKRGLLYSASPRFDGLTKRRPIARTFSHDPMRDEAFDQETRTNLRPSPPMNSATVFERFHGPNLDPRLKWRCPPAQWSILDSRLIVHPDASTDFWQRTHYGFSADNGHFLNAEVTGDFTLATRVRFAPAHQYDQAGLMVRCSPDCWVKTSVEFEPGGPNRLGAVVTRGGYSDWSTQDFAADRDTLEVRISVSGQDALVEYLETEVPGPGGKPPRWVQLRLAHLPLPPGQPIQAGLYACSPKGAGFSAEFHYLHLEPAGAATLPH
jgi:regulation of enolase protein 1 (concanavalin A-like superfamily)